METTGTIQITDGTTDHITAQGGTYEEAEAALKAAVPGGNEADSNPYR